MKKDDDIKLDTGSTAGKVLILVGAIGGVITIFSMVYIGLAELAAAWPLF